MGKVSNDVRTEIRNFVEEKAKAARYGTLNRTESGKFIDELTRDPFIAGKLKEFLSKDKIRTYIKDSILNRYTKHLNEIPRDVSEILKKHYGNTYTEVQFDKSNRISIHRSTLEETDNQITYLVVSRGTFLKWETTLRKAVQLITTSPLLNSATVHVKIMIVVMVNANSVTQADKSALAKALRFLSVEVSFVDA